MILIRNGEVSGNTPPNIYIEMEPWAHPSGALWWFVDPSEKPFTDSDGQIYHIRKRTIEEMQATPEFIAWQAANQISVAQGQAKTDLGAVPGWMKTFTAAQAEAYIETNVTTLASAKTVLKIMAKMLVLIRDHTRFVE